MVLTVLYFLFGGVASVTVGKYTLEPDVIFVEVLFEEVVAFAVDDVEIGFVAIVLEVLVACLPGINDGFILTVLEGIIEGCIGIVFI